MTFSEKGAAIFFMHSIKKMTNMKHLKLIFTFLLASFLLGACSDDDVNKNAWGDSYARFVRSAMTVRSTSGEAEAVVQWLQSTWEITLGEGNIVQSVSPATGGGNASSLQFTKVRLTCNANLSAEPRTQTLHLTDQSGVTTDLVVTQEGLADRVVLDVDASVAYQPVVGFGGMYNPAIWTGSNVLSTDEMNTLYSSEGMGYSILRLMIYADENRWADDVAGAKQAQDLGAIVFACPWEAPAELTDQVDGTPHVKPENYAAYADHLISYINYMKDNGVDIYAISVQNEPDMDFTAWTPSEVVNFLKQEGARIRATGAKLMAPEACGTQPEYTDPVLADAEAFAQTDIVAGHLYQGFIEEDGGYAQNRHDYVCGLYPRLGGKTWWMTEHLFNDGENETDPAQWVFRNWDYNFTHLATEIHKCMEGYCSAYVYWYLKRFYGLIGDNDQRSPVAEGEVSKNGYIMAHYAKYATGMTRVAVTSSKESCWATAYVNEDGTELTLVLLNADVTPKTVEIQLPGIRTATAVETSETQNMQPVDVSVSDDRLTLPISVQGIVSVRIALD